MGEVLRFVGLMGLGLAGTVFVLAMLADPASARTLLDLPSYAAGMAAGIVLTTVVRFGLGTMVAALGRTLAHWGPGFKLLVLAALFGGVLIFY